MARLPHRAVVVVAIVSLAGALTSCGDDEDRLSKAAFTKELNSLCAQREKDLAYLDETNFFDMKEGTKVWPKAKARIETFVDDVGELSPPEDADELVDGYLDGGDEVLAEVDDVIDAAEDGNLKAYNQHLVALFTKGEAIDMQADDYGADDCYDEDEALPQSQEPAPGSTTVEIGAKEYEFDIPTDIEAGKTAFELANRGNEIHIFGFGRLKEGATFQQLQDAIANGEEDPGLLEDEGLTGLAAPDGTATTNADLEPGTYVAYCFIPAPDGEPHLAKGMLAQFDVS